MSGYRSYRGAMYGRARAISGNGRRGRRGGTRRTGGGNDTQGILLFFVGITSILWIPYLAACIWHIFN